MSITLLSSAVLSSGLLDVVKERAASFHSVVFTTIVLTLLIVWIVVDIVSKTQASLRERKETPRRRQLGLSVDQRKTISNLAELANRALTLCAVLICLYVLGFEGKNTRDKLADAPIVLGKSSIGAETLNNGVEKARLNNVSYNAERQAEASENELAASANAPFDPDLLPLNSESFTETFSPYSTEKLISEFTPEARSDSSNKIRQIGYTDKSENIDEKKYVNNTAAYSSNGERSLLEQQDEEIERLIRKVRRGVFSITVQRTSSTPGRVDNDNGAAFFAYYNGKPLAITNFHVVERAASHETTKLLLPDRQGTLSPTVVRCCPDFDVAVLELSPEQLPKDGSLQTCEFTDSDTLGYGHKVFAFGSPFALHGTVTSGGVSALYRSNKDLKASTDLQEYIQYDAPTNPGNSGGPLINTRGKVVGLVTTICTENGKNSGVSFAIPSNVLLRIVKRLMDEGEWKACRLGITLQRATRKDLKSIDPPTVYGAKIVKVDADSPAAKAGLRVDDVVLSIDGTLVKDDNHMSRTIALVSPREMITLSVLREGKILELEASPTLEQQTAAPTVPNANEVKLARVQ